MGFSGGGSNVLKNHKHDATVVQDGGSLDADNVTSADLTQGDVIFSDGTHLQRLAIGTPAQQIQVNAGATAPEYFTPAGAAGGSLEFIEEIGLGADASSWTMTLASGHVMADYESLIAQIMVRCDTTNTMTYRVNGISASSYITNYMQTQGGTVTGYYAANQSSAQLTSNFVGTASAFINIEVFENSAQSARDFTKFEMGGNSDNYITGQFFTETDYSTLTSMALSVNAGIMYAAGARARFYRVKKT